MRRRLISGSIGIINTDYPSYFTIEALEDGLQAKLSVNACEYSLDGNIWNSLSVATNTPAVNTGEKIYFRGNLTPTLSNGIGTFTISKKCNLKGNIMSLLYGDDFSDKTDLSGKNHAFYELFYDCTTIVNASELLLPATTLATSCYEYMFSGCTRLTTAPALPATTLASSCYSAMFSRCTRLTTAPKLPATTLADACYSAMFSRCNGLTTAPELPVTTLATYCYQYMFRDCTSLTTAPKLPATTLADACYYNMFYGCTSLVEAPQLLATTLVSMCYSSMFYGCSKLNKITMLATNINAMNHLYLWVSGVSSTGTFVKHPDMTSLPTGTSGVPSGWTVVDYVESNLITFIIDGVEYQAEEGMTWGEWVDTPYNTLGLINQEYIDEETGEVFYAAIRNPIIDRTLGYNYDNTDGTDGFGAQEAYPYEEIRPNWIYFYLKW